ncbi:MAG: GNAT family N-acetyltransferase [Proteobacteria bacterium]|nr:GNAT family N-acetyltransferase [Pseudomonadota bacterium]
MIDVRTITADEVPAFREAMMATFGFDDEADPDGATRTRALLAPAQMWAAFDDGTVVATAAAFDLALGLPGGASLPMGRALPAIYAAATAARPGVLRRSETWWRERRFLDAPMMRGGASRRRYVVARRGADDVGYLVYRQRPGSLGGRASGRVELVELIAVDATAEATLWRFACALDLFPIVAWSDAPTDCPVSWLVDDPRRVQRTRIDSLWLRIEDVATALAARHYPSEGVLTLAIDDVIWQLAALGGRGRCTPSTGPAQLRLTRSTLGALYLGGTPASQLARAGLVDGDPAALALADRLFASPIAPWCPEVF